MQFQSVADPARPMRMASVPDGKGGFVHQLVPATTGPVPKGKKKRIVPDPIKANPDAAAQQLRQFIERAERKEVEIEEHREEYLDIFREAKATGYDVKTMKAILARRKKDRNSLMEDEALLETYLAPLGLD